VQFRTNPDGSITEIPPERCPNGHELRYPNVIVAHWAEAGQRQACARLALPDL
jgi:hypothetical protein